MILAVLFLRFFWPLVMAGLTIYAFHRSWRWEHGAPMPENLFSDKPRAKETVVWVDPSVLPILLLTILLIWWAFDGTNGVERFFALLLDVMVIISLYFLVLFCLLPLLRRHFSARACATLWILPVFMFWQAHMLYQNAPVPRWVFYIPSHILEPLYLVWGIGFCAVFAAKTISHFLFRHRVLSVATPVRDREVLELFEKELQRLEFSDPVRLVISPAVAAPLSMGTTKRSRVTVLPDRSFTRQQLQFIFCHEIHHLQRRDVGNKIFFAFCQALCWFNPLMWVAVSKASDDLELSCDEIVLEGMDESLRRQYARLLLDTAGSSRGFTTCLSATAQTMRYRLRHVMNVRRRQLGTLLLGAAMFLCVVSYGTVAVSHDKGTVAELITEQRTAADVQSVYHQSEGWGQLERATVRDTQGLFSYLTSLDVEKLSSANEISVSSGQRLSLFVTGYGSMQLQFHDRILQVDHVHDGLHKAYYYLRSPLDWETVSSFLEPYSLPME